MGQRNSAAARIGLSNVRRKGGLIEGDASKDRVAIAGASRVCKAGVAHTAQQSIVRRRAEWLVTVEKLREKAVRAAGEVEQLETSAWPQHAAPFGQRLRFVVARQVVKHHRREHAVERRGLVRQRVG